MTAPLALVCFALVLAFGAVRLLQAADWPSRAPRAGILAWQALTLSVATSLLLAAVTLALPLLPMRSDLARIAGITPREIDEHYLTPVGAVLAGVGCAVAVLIVVRLVALIAARLFRERRQRARHVDGIALIAASHPDGYLVIDHPRAEIYCLPGRARTVVVTTGAQQSLTSRQLTLVLGHERAHLRARHDLPLALADALHRTFRLPVFAVARHEIAVLVEMQADDSATSASDRRDLARALVAMASTDRSRTTPGLAAGSVAALARVRRLAQPSAPTPQGSFALSLTLSSLAMLLLPWVLALVPAAEANLRECCGQPGAIAPLETRRVDTPQITVSAPYRTTWL